MYALAACAGDLSQLDSDLILTRFKQLGIVPQDAEIDLDCILRPIPENIEA